MSDKDTSGQAFPSQFFADQSGMTLRDYFAAHAPDVPESFSKMVNKKSVKTGFDKFEVLNIVETDSECLIRWRWHYADSMLAAREFGK